MASNEPFLEHEFFTDPTKARGRQVTGDDMTLTLPDTTPALLARLDERTGAMTDTLRRIENTTSERFVVMERDMETQRKRLEDLEAWKNRIEGTGLEKQNEQIRELWSWKDRILGLGLILGPAMTIGSAYLVKHLP